MVRFIEKIRMITFIKKFKTYGLFGPNYRVATFNLTVSGIIIPSFKTIGHA